ncbi:hypothetical protein T484DRAFT_1776121, partial [Baffinella frigidus]
MPEGYTDAQVTLGTNVPLNTKCPTRIRVSNLVDESTRSYSTALKNPAPLVPYSSGSISLTGAQHLAHDNTTWDLATEMWWAPGFCNVNDRLGTDYFMESCDPAGGVCTDAGNRGLAMWDNGYVDEISGSMVANNYYTVAGYAAQQHEAFTYKTSTSSSTTCDATQFNAGWGYTSGGKLVKSTTGFDISTMSGVDVKFTANKRLEMWVAQNTEAGENYVIQFYTTNPIKQQNPPTVKIEGIIGFGSGDSSDLQKTQSVQASSLAPGSTTVNTASTAALCGRDYSVPMNSDATSVLCCASCSEGRGAVDAKPGRTDTNGLGQMTPYGDAEPLKVHEPFFCTKSIGQ